MIHPTFDRDIVMKDYIYNTIGLVCSDYIGKLMRDTALYKEHRTIPRLPFVYNHYNQITTMHYKTLDVLMLLHKLKVRPS